MANLHIVGKVISDEIFFVPTENDGVTSFKKMDAEVAVITKEANEYSFRPHEMNDSEFYLGYLNKSFRVAEIVEVAEGLFHLALYAVSTKRKPFLVVELNKQQVIDWHDAVG